MSDLYNQKIFTTIKFGYRITAMRLIFLILFVPFVSHAQLSKQDSLWMPFQPLIGTWAGTGEGVDGNGSYERTYQFVLNKKYIEVRNRTVYSMTKEKPKGYVHEDVGFISYDKIRKTFVFRQFYGEGFVNQYTLDSLSGRQTDDGVYFRSD
jgi:hypothetical protein